MPDVRVTNPEVDIDLYDKERTTVPSGEKWIVDITSKGSNGTKLRTRSSTSHTFRELIDTREKRVQLTGGDIINARGSVIAAVRGYVVST